MQLLAKHQFTIAGILLAKSREMHRFLCGKPASTQQVLRACATLHGPPLEKEMGVQTLFVWIVCDVVLVHVIQKLACASGFSSGGAPVADDVQHLARQIGPHTPTSLAAPGPLCRDLALSKHAPARQITSLLDMVQPSSILVALAHAPMEAGRRK